MKTFEILSHFEILMHDRIHFEILIHDRIHFEILIHDRIHLEILIHDRKLVIEGPFRSRINLGKTQRTS